MDESTSRQLYDRALGVLVGGVNSSVRAVRPYPAFIRRGDGSHVVDVDGNRYLDYVMGYGPLLLGHDLPESVRGAIQSTASEGPMYGAPVEAEVELAEFVADHVPSVDQIRFVNSGTEATVSAIRLARGYTGRDRVVLMDGGYHGANDMTLVEGAPGRVDPSTDGLPRGLARHATPVPFNDAEAVTEVFEANPDDIAAVLVEPILGNTGIVEPVDGYLATLRSLCDEHGAVLIFDEVITGFRIGGLQCAQGAVGVTPDVTTFGKVIGGGFPVGAIGGSAAIMSAFTPVGDVFQSGTFSGHPVVMAAGLATLRHAAETGVYEHVDRLGAELRAGLRDVVAERAPSYTVVGTGSMFKVIFTRGERGVSTAADVRAADRERWDRLFRPAMKERGVFLPPNQHESQFISAAHTEEEIEATLEAYNAAL